MKLEKSWIRCEVCEFCVPNENENTIPSNNYICTKNEVIIDDIEQDYCCDFNPE